MKGASGGYTIIEVLIVLTVSSFMLIAAASVFSGRRQSAEFSQAIYDLQSQIQSIGDRVSSHNVPGLGRQNCSLASYPPSSTYRPVFGGATNSGECIYLGQIIQFTTNSSTIFSYPIFGLSTVYAGSISSGIAPSSYAQSNPEPALDTTVVSPASSDFLYKDTYVMLNGITISSATWNGSESDLLGLYANLQDNNTSGNGVAAYAYPYTNNAANPEIQVKNCIEGSIAACNSGNIVTNTYWKICVTDKSRSAQLTVKGTPTGIGTTVNMAGCP